MSKKYNEFTEKFRSFYGTDYYKFINDFNDNCHKFDNYRQVYIKDDNEYDSYGCEDSKLERVFKFNDFDGIYVKFKGIRQSYNGEEWNEMYEVIPKQVTSTIYE